MVFWVVAMWFLGCSGELLCVSRVFWVVAWDWFLGCSEWLLGELLCSFLGILGG